MNLVTSSIRGHEAVRRRFESALGTGRLAHAYLFVGPSGVGKKRFAVELAKRLLCEGASSALVACGACAACHLVDAQTHPDLIVAGKAIDRQEFQLEKMREVIRQLGLRPSRGRHRITIIDDANDFNEESANCFLKTLEEPPPGSLLILIGTEAAFQLPTIRSRCQVITFAALSDDLVREALSGQSIDEDRANQLVRLAAGSPGLAVAMSDPALWSARQVLIDTLLQARPDAQKLAKAWMEWVEAAGKDGSLQRPRALQLLHLAIDVLRLALARSLGSQHMLCDADEIPVLQQLAEKLGADELLERIDRVIDAEWQVDRRVQLILVIEAVADAITRDSAIEPHRAIGWHQ